MTTRPRPARGGGETREQMVRAGIDVVKREGLRGVRISAIAAAVGVSGPAVYRHFADRDALGVACARAALEELERTLSRQLRRKGLSDGLEAMAGALLDFPVRTIVRWNAEALDASMASESRHLLLAAYQASVVLPIAGLLSTYLEPPNPAHHRGAAGSFVYLLAGIEEGVAPAVPPPSVTATIAGFLATTRAAAAAE